MSRRASGSPCVLARLPARPPGRLAGAHPGRVKGRAGFGALPRPHPLQSGCPAAKASKPVAGLESSLLSITKPDLDSALALHTHCGLRRSGFSSPTFVISRHHPVPDGVSSVFFPN